MNVSSWLKASTADRLDSELILAHALGVDRTFLHAHPERELTPAALQAANDLLRRRQNHEPLAYLVGHKEFYGRDFAVTPDTLIPRPETEALIDAIKPLNPRKILDVGTGSGCIAITLALELPESKVEAVDISEGALKIASQNAQNLGANVKFYLSNLLQNTNKYDLIVANLPYVDPAWDWLSPELAFEPQTALYSDNHGLSHIERLISEAASHLAPNGYLVLEADLSQHQKISAFARDFHFSSLNDGQSLALSLALVLRYEPSRS